MAAVKVVQCGTPRSLPSDLVRDDHDADVLILAGAEARDALSSIDVAGWKAVLVELDVECLGEYVDDDATNVLGFARYALGSGEPSLLAELVCPADADGDAVAAARQFFDELGWETVECSDTPGRIVDRLVRPFLNDALAALDERLADAGGLDTTVELGLGHPEGPIRLLDRTGLAEHARVSGALFARLGEAALLPGRRARLARARQLRQVHDQNSD